MYSQNGWWYFRYTDNDGKTRTKACGTKDEAEARFFMENFVPGLKRLKKPSTLEQLLRLFMDADNNPSYLDARVTGKNYGKRHSIEVARNMRDLLNLLKGNNQYWSTTMRKLTRFDCKQIRTMIHGKWGNTSKAKSTFSQFKCCLTYAADEGWIPVSPCAGMDEIKAEIQSEVIPMTIGDIQTIIENPSLFRFRTKPCNERNRRWREGKVERDHAIFTVLALTGMRRAELAAMTSDQVVAGVSKHGAFHYLVIDKAYKLEKWDDDDEESVGLPKWNFSRAIPLPDLAYKALEPYLRTDGERVFDINQSQFKTMFRRLKQNAKDDGIKWEDKEAFDMLTPHKLRHALNTNLLTCEAEGVDSLKIAEFLSWEHQDDLKKVQRRYTHMVASRLIPVKNVIDGWFTNEAEATPLPLRGFGS